MFKGQNLFFLVFLFLYSSTNAISTKNFKIQSSNTASSYPFEPTIIYSHPTPLPAMGSGIICITIQFPGLIVGIFANSNERPIYEASISKNKITLFKGEEKNKKVVAEGNTSVETRSFSITI